MPKDARMAGALAGKRVLVVEDEFYIAADLKLELTRQDAIVLGPVASVDAGLALIADDAPDAAILDVKLDGANTFAIADRLTAQSVPFLFLTGYDEWALPPGYRAVERATKPLPLPEVVLRVKQLIGG